MLRLSLVLLTLALPLASSAAPVGTAFTYQGELHDGGIPVEGAVDLRFSLYDADVAGSLVGLALQLDDVPVTGGVFSAELDFGAAFDGEERWLEIAVRSPHDPTNALPFQTLDPRQAVRPTPYAVRSLEDANWARSGSALTNTNPAGPVLLNRDYTVGAEWFGVHAPVAAGYGGMYVSTEGSTARPFYGYRTPSQTAWAYLDGDSGDWRLYVDGERLTVTDTGNVGVGTTSPVEKLTVAGTVHSTSGGFRFPDGSVQTSAAALGSADGNSLDASDGSPLDVVTVDAFGRTFVDGDLGVGNNPGYRLDVREEIATSNIVHLERIGDAAASSDLLELQMGATASVDAQFIEAQLVGNDVKFRVWGDGNVSADGAFTAGGADFAELVRVPAGHSTVEAGDVMVIDPRSTRGFAKSSSAHSTLVAGVYSTKPGVLGTETDWDALEEPGPDGERQSRKSLDIARDHDEVPVALVGIVPCKVSAENGPVRAGDLLVTSATPGHAMRADDPRPGTIVGKALEDMDGKTDRITVMVTLH